MQHTDLYKTLLDSVYEGIYFVDQERTITFWNKGAERITGFSAEEVLDRHCYDDILNHVDEEGNKLCFGGCPLHATIADGKQRETRVYLQHKAGYRVPVKVKATPILEDGKIVGAVELFMGEEDEVFVNYQLETLKALAYQDQLTGLPNRRMIDQRLAMMIDFAEKTDKQVAIGFLDIDFFKKVNDVYGHTVGDEVLQMVAKTIQNSLRNSDFVGRWGGEEFICLFEDSTPEALYRSAERIRMLIENSALRTATHEIRVTISIGTTLYQKGESVEVLTQRADALLYQSKRDGRNRVTIG